MPRFSPPHAALALSLSLGACAHAPHAPPPRAVALDLTPAAATIVTPEARALSARADGISPEPDACPSPRCGVAGEAGAVTLDAPREEALALFARYVRAVSGRSTDAVRALLDDDLSDARDGTPVSREAVVTLHARLFEVMDARGFEATEVRALSQPESRRMNRGVQMDARDWVIEWRTQSFRATPFAAVTSAPTLIVVRWRGGVARIAAFDHEFLTRRTRSL